MTSLFWFRRDLRLHDNAGLYEALKGPYPVQPIFIFDSSILDRLDEKADNRVQFVHTAIEKLNHKLLQNGASLRVYHGNPAELMHDIIREFEVQAVYTNHDYEPYARERDHAIGKYLASVKVPFRTYKDQVIFEKDEVLKSDGKPYTVFTPYMKRWKELLKAKDPPDYNITRYTHNFLRSGSHRILSMDEIGFKHVEIDIPPKDINEETLLNYHNTRDFPYLRGTSRISVHLRFGTVSIRDMVKLGFRYNEKWLNELIWREFYMGNILWHFPHVAERSFKPIYDRIPWLNREEDFEAWREGSTGYPIVDAGMRELNKTGFMHNRLRMITASFLVKHLLIDWRWGEAYFAQKLLDYELSSNNGGWQWAAGSGCDAAPYFRVFNPELQRQKFDPEFRYIRKFVPEFEDAGIYPKPIVEHTFARKRALRVYSSAMRG